MSKNVFSFGGGTADGDGKMKEVLGGKGAGLAEMSRAGLPVPAGFTIATHVCNSYFANGKQIPDSVQTEIGKALTKLEKEMGQKLGDAKNPMLLSVRSGARFSMPGMMNTILNLGLNDTTTAGLAARSGNERFAYDCYRRFIQMFGEVALEIEMEKFDHIFDARKAKMKVKTDSDLTAEDLKAVIADYKKLVLKETKKPEDAREQLNLSVGAVFGSWWNPKAAYYRKMEKIPDEIGTAANVQAMVFGNMGETSGTGVGFTRDPGTGEKVFYGEFLMNAQGEDVVAGIRTPLPISELEAILPEAFAELKEITTNLEKHYKDMQDFEFTIQDKKLYMLQTRNGKRTGPAAVKVAVDMVGEGMITKEEAILRVAPSQLDQLLHPVFDPKTLKDLVKLTTGISASPGAAVGRVAFSAEDAVEMVAKGPVLLVRKETTPDDIHGMDVAKGILTAIGGKSSHAAVVARGMGRPCVVGAGEIRIDEKKKVFTAQVGGKTITVKEGDFISLDGTTGDIYLGHANTVEPNLNHDFVGTFMSWTDEYRGKFGIRANADIPRDAKVARTFGAAGIGLCRTEHKFFAEDRLPHVVEMILARDEKSRRKALAKLLPIQRADFAGLFKAMDGYPVVIRTLDPPLHEFLPHAKEQQSDLARKLNIPVEKIMGRVHELHEFNPMLGFRGCRLGIKYPEITRMQARAVLEAAADATKKGFKAKPEIMIPLVGFKKELDLQVAIVHEVAALVQKEKKVKIAYSVGTMIEIPRGALTADEIAHTAEFFSFGTNDLTQTCLGMSRDDSGSFLGAYTENEIVKKNPFASIDQTGVGQLIQIAAEKGNKTRPGIKLGICGEHGGDPDSVKFCHRVGLTYVSCSPYRVPVARLAAAQAAIEEKRAAAKSAKKK